jgi:hypothetical protein
MVLKLDVLGVIGKLVEDIIHLWRGKKIKSEN